MKRPRNLDRMDACARIGWKVIEVALDASAKLAAGEVKSASLLLGRHAYHCAIGWQQFESLLERFPAGVRTWRGIRIEVTDDLPDMVELHLF